MRAAQQRRADDRPQVVRVFHAVGQHQEGRLPLLAGGGQQIVQGRVGDGGGVGRHPLMAVGAAGEAQLVGVHPLDHRARLPGQRSVVGRHRLRQALAEQHGVHAGAAFQQFRHRVLAVYQALFGPAVLVFIGAVAHSVSFFEPAACAALLAVSIYTEKYTTLPRLLPVFDTKFRPVSTPPLRRRAFPGGIFGILAKIYSESLAVDGRAPLL